MLLRTLPGLVLFFLFCAGAGFHSGRLAGRLDRERDARADSSMRVELLKQDLPRTGRYSAMVASERLGHWVALPRSPLEPMAIGLAPSQANGRPLTNAPGEDWPFEPAESALFLRTLHLDPALIMILFLPLIVLCGPRVSPGLLMGAVAAASLAAFAASGAAAGPVEGWWRWLLWTGLSVAAGWFWSGVREWCDRQHEPERAAVAAYVVLVLLVPGVLSIVASAMPPVNGAASLVEIRKATSARLREDSAKLAVFHEAHPDLIDGADTAAYDRLRLDATEAYDRAAAPILQRDRNERQRYRWVNDVLRLLTPVTALQGGLVEAAGTSGSRAALFSEQVDRFIGAEWLPYFAARARSAAGFTRADFAKLPGFKYEPQSLADTGARVALPLVVVVAFGFLFRRLSLSLRY